MTKVRRGAQQPRGRALRRTLRVLGELSKSPWHLPELAEHVGCRLRTIYRDLDAIRDAGLNVEVITSGRPGPGGQVLHRITRQSVREALGW